VTDIGKETLPPTAVGASSERELHIPALGGVWELFGEGTPIEQHSNPSHPHKLKLPNCHSFNPLVKIRGPHAERTWLPKHRSLIR
jgi:hypothetical protein